LSSCKGVALKGDEYQVDNFDFVDSENRRRMVHDETSRTDIERRLSAELICSMIEETDESFSRDYHNLSICSTATYYYDALNGEWLDDDGDTIYQSFIDGDSMMHYDFTDDVECDCDNDTQIDCSDHLQSNINEGDVNELNISLLIGEEYVDELDTNLDEFCEQLSLELDQVSNVVFGKAPIVNETYT
jgi:hypothetical protein